MLLGTKSIRRSSLWSELLNLLVSLARARLSHFGRESGQTPIPVLFRRSVLTKQQRAACVTGRHESVEIVRAKRCLFESLRPCASYYLRAKYLMTYLLLLRMLLTIFVDLQNKTGIGVWPDSLPECESLAVWDYLLGKMVQLLQNLGWCCFV